MKFTKAEIDAIIEASPRTCVSFNKLVLSQDYQARAGGSTPKLNIAELAASIKECGVLQNLVVVQGARGRYDVCAGGRRLEALTLLVGSGDLADNYPVPVLIVPADKALIASLSENVFHIPMHPADEFAAFAKLIGQGKSVEDVAAAFGVTPLVVKRRMKLWEDFYCDWRALWFNQRIEPPSWIVGDTVIAAGGKGILFPSQANAGGSNLVLFVNALTATDSLQVYDPGRSLPQNQNSWAR